MRTMRTLTLNETDWREFQARRGESLKPVGASRRSEVLNEWFVGLQRLWRHVQATRSRDAIYGYLRRVFDFVRGWKNRGRGRRLVRHAQEFAGAEINKNAEIYSTIIKATTDADDKTISKFSRVLRYCERAKSKDDGLKRFIKRAGGLNACADQFTEILGQPRPRARSPKARRLIRK